MQQKQPDVLPPMSSGSLSAYSPSTGTGKRGGRPRKSSPTIAPRTSSASLSESFALVPGVGRFGAKIEEVEGVEEEAGRGQVRAVPGPRIAPRPLSGRNRRYRCSRGSSGAML